MSVSNILKTVKDAADPSLYTNASKEERAELVAACAKLQCAAEDPFETSIRILISPYNAIALRLGVDMKLFDRFEGHDSEEVTSVQLAERVGAEPLLVTRVLRVLSHMDLFKEVGIDRYTRLPLADAYVSVSPLAAAVIHFTAALGTSSRFPRYFEEKGYKNPEDAYDAPFQYAEGTSLSYWEWLPTKPKLHKVTNMVMAFARKGRKSEWFEFFPAAEKLHVTSPEDTLLVDIGGGLGQAVIAFKEKFPSIPGKLVVQDLPGVVESIVDLPAGIQAMPYDFFKPQSVKGARAYYLRAVLHDWPDKQSLQILGRVRDAMAKDSILLINEVILPDSNVSMLSAQIDLEMMNMGALERTESQFKCLLEKAGFELVKIWRPEVEDHLAGTVIEAVLKK